MISVRAQALALGEKRYMGSKPCKRGHLGDRYTINSMCVECIREYRAANIDWVREQARELDRKWSKKKATYYTAHREDIRAKQAANYVAHREGIRAKQAAYVKANPGAFRARNANRRAMEKQQRCVCCSNADIQKFYDIATLCGRGAEVDHIVQLSLGGPHCAKNLVALTFEDHKIKSKLDAAERAESRRRNTLLRNWAHAAPVPVLPKVSTVVPITPLGPTRAVFAAAA